MSDSDKIKLICQEYGIVPSKSKGQNFLIDNNIVKKIFKEGKIGKDDIVLEVGPGLGVMTGDLISQSKKVIAVELDKKIFQYLQNVFGLEKNLKLINKDILKLDLSKLGVEENQYRIIANLPYNITSHFLRVFLANKIRPKDMILMMQKEVAERIVALPGEMSVLSVMVQYYCDPKILFKVSPSSFWPKPKVDSAIIRLNLNKRLVDTEGKSLMQIVKIGFSSKRKQLQNNLSTVFKIDNHKVKEILIELGLNEKIRAQDLSIDDWVKLRKKI